MFRFTGNFIPSVLEYQKQKNISGKVLLLLDNAPSHPFVHILNNINENFEVLYLPPNVTAIIQPMDQGVISITKKLYKKYFVSKLLSEEPFNIDNFLKKFTIKDCIDLISKAWQNIQPSTLMKVWRPMLKDLINRDESSQIENNKESVELCDCVSQQLKNNNIDVSEIEKWIVIEEKDEGWEQFTDAEIVETTTNNYREFINIEENNLEENESLTEISHTEAYKYLQYFKDWYEKQHDCDITDIFIINKLLRFTVEKYMQEEENK